MTDLEKRQILKERLLARKAELQKINESVLDPVRSTRCKELFDDNENILPDVRTYILKSIQDWEETLEFPLNIKYIRLVGSLLGFQYSAETDVDVHIRCDITEEQSDIIYKSRPNCLFVPNTLHPLEFSFLTNDEKLDNAENIYDLVNRTWIKKSEREEIDIPKDYIYKICKAFMGMIDVTFGSVEVHKKQLAELDDLEISEKFSEEDKLRAIFRKRDELLEDLDTLRLTNRLMSALRDQAYNMEERKYFNLSIEIVLPDDPHYSANEMIFKTIDKYGYKDKVRKVISELEEIIEKLNNLRLPIQNGEETLERDDGEVSADSMIDSQLDDIQDESLFEDARTRAKKKAMKAEKEKEKQDEKWKKKTDKEKENKKIRRANKALNIEGYEYDDEESEYKKTADDEDYHEIIKELGIKTLKELKEKKKKEREAAEKKKK